MRSTLLERGWVRVAGAFSAEEDGDPLLLHTGPTNAGRQPRFLLDKDLRASSS